MKKRNNSYQNGSLSYPSLLRAQLTSLNKKSLDSLIQRTRHSRGRHRDAGPVRQPLTPAPPATVPAPPFAKTRHPITRTRPHAPATTPPRLLLLPSRIRSPNQRPTTHQTNNERTTPFHQPNCNTRAPTFNQQQNAAAYAFIMDGARDYQRRF